MKDLNIILNQIRNYLDCHYPNYNIVEYFNEKNDDALKIIFLSYQFVMDHYQESDRWHQAVDSLAQWKSDQAILPDKKHAIENLISLLVFNEGVTQVGLMNAERQLIEPDLKQNLNEMLTLKYAKGWTRFFLLLKNSDQNDKEILLKLLKTKAWLAINISKCLADKIDDGRTGLHLLAESSIDLFVDIMNQFFGNHFQLIEDNLLLALQQRSNNGKSGVQIFIEVSVELLEELLDEMKVSESESSLLQQMAEALLLNDNEDQTGFDYIAKYKPGFLLEITNYIFIQGEKQQDVLEIAFIDAAKKIVVEYENFENLNCEQSKAIVAIWHAKLLNNDSLIIVNEIIHDEEKLNAVLILHQQDLLGKKTLNQIHNENFYANCVAVLDNHNLLSNANLTLLHSKNNREVLSQFQWMNDDITAFLKYIKNPNYNNILKGLENMFYQRQWLIAVLEIIQQSEALETRFENLTAQMTLSRGRNSHRLFNSMQSDDKGSSGTEMENKKSLRKLKHDYYATFDPLFKKTIDQGYMGMAKALYELVGSNKELGKAIDFHCLQMNSKKPTKTRKKFNKLFAPCLEKLDENHFSPAVQFNNS